MPKLMDLQHFKRNI